MFLNITMLAGLAGAAVPLVLHLLSKARYRSVDWGAMMFLETSDSRQRQSTKLKQLVLLLMRMAIIGVLAMALARPVVRGAWGPLAAEGRLTAVIVLDRSASMGFDENGRSRLDLAKEAVLQILSGLRKGDQVSLVLVGDNDPHPDVRPTSDLQAVAGRVNQLRVSFSQANIVDGMIKAVEVFDRYEKLNRELYVVCDHQASSWQQANDAFHDVWQQRLLKSSGQTPRFFVIPVGGGGADNVAVQSLEILNPPGIKDQPSDVEVQIRNFGAIPRASLPLTLYAGGKEIHSTTVNISPDATASVRVSVKFPEAGSQVLSASVKTAGLTADDRLDCAIDVVEPIKVLVVSGDERTGSFRSEADFLRLALAPYQTVKRPGPDPAVVTVIPAEKWTEVDLSPYQVVVLANISQFTGNQVRAVEQFVYNGGGLLIAPGNLARIENYNSLLYRDGAGIMPAMLQQPVAGDGSQATSVLGLDLSHPVFRFLKGRPDPVPAATVGRYFPAEPRPADARVLASYVSGTPFLTEIASSHGRVLLLTTPVDADWSTLPLSNFYLPFVQSAVRYLAAGTFANRNLGPGQPIVTAFTEPITDLKAAVLLPDGKQDTIEMSRFGERTEARFADTSQPGPYTMTVRTAKGERKLHFVVRPPRDESDLTPLTNERWASLAKGLEFERIDLNQAPLSASLASARTGKELWPTLLACVFALSLIELSLARRWSLEEK